MPKSKHRRKPGGKAVPHPGRGKAPKEWEPTPEALRWRRFRDGYLWPFLEKYQDDGGPLSAAGYMLDLISDAAFVETGLRPVSKAEVFREFMEPLDPEDAEEESRPNPDAALAFLVDQGMVEVAGDTITVPARFWIEAPNGETPPAS
jgi:hypothetical protein